MKILPPKSLAYTHMWFARANVVYLELALFSLSRTIFKPGQHLSELAD